MKLSCSSKVIKYLMFVFNFIFVITGIIILAVGVTVKTVYYQYDTFLDEKYFSLPNLLIATGAFIFIISFFGCYGAMKENWILLGIFSVLLIMIFIFEFSAGIAGYVLRDKTASYLDTKLYDGLSKYSNNSEFAYMWDLIQRKFECCGVRDVSDWSTVNNNNYSLPLSCCPPVDGTIGVFYCNAAPKYNTTTTVLPTSDTPSTKVTTEATTLASPATTTNTTIDTNNKTDSNRRKRDVQITTIAPQSTSTPYSTGCEEAFGDFVRKHAVQIGGCAMALAVIQFMGILFSCHLARQLKNGYYST